MEIKINDVSYPLNFGIKFIREIDKHTETKMNGVKFSQGLAFLLGQALDGKLGAFSDIVYYATCADDIRPSRDDVDNYLDSLSSSKFDKFYNDVLQEIENSNAGKRIYKKVEKEQQMTTEQLAQMMKALK